MINKKSKLLVLMLAQIFIMSLCCLSSNTAEADTSLFGSGIFQGGPSGETSDGWIVLIDDYRNVQMLKKGDEEGGESAVFFPNEPCDLEKLRVLQNEKPSYALTCANTAASPLRGTRFVSKYVKGDCIKGEPAYQVYICVSGCQNDIKTPKKLRQDYWNCAESLSERIEETKRMLPAAAAKPITPEIVREIEKVWTDFCTASENPSDSISGGIRQFKANLAGFNPGESVANDLRVKYGIIAIGETKAVVMQQPTHGTVKLVELVAPDADRNYASYEIFEYTPENNFHGNDKVAFEVTVNGKKFRNSYIIRVTNSVEGACE